MDEQDFQSLETFLLRIPGVHGAVSKGDDGGFWWVKFIIDIKHPLAWHVVQELGHILNYLSLEERLPTVFKPVSPPPYLNGGPEFLSWVIETEDKSFDPSTCAEWLEERLPQPVDDEAEWKISEEAT